MKSVKLSSYSLVIYSRETNELLDNFTDFMIQGKVNVSKWLMSY